MAAESLALEPALISQLTRTGIIGTGAEALEAVVPCLELTDQELAQLQSDLESANIEDGLQRALRGERVAGIEVFRNPAMLHAEWDRKKAAKIARSRKEDMAFFLDCAERFLVAAEKPWPQAIQDAELVANRVEEYAGSITGRFRFIVTDLLATPLNSVFIACARTEAHSRVASTACAIERYRRKYDATPAMLQQLVPEFLTTVPNDPFDSAPLRYLRHENGYTVYSVSVDGKDDGGQQENYALPDLAFTVALTSESVR
jgi:hypothetical protein